jgi:radical SAM superfamily enzyme YgiQ (UPF0313 family)
MKALLVQAWDGGVVDYFISPPLGIHRVRKWAEAELGTRMEITCFDPNIHIEPRTMLKRMAAEGRFDVIAFSPLHLTLENDIALMYDVHGVSPHSLYVVGGQQAAFANELLFQSFPGLDVVVIGEGERPFTAILTEALRHGTAALKTNPAPLAQIPGLYLKAAPTKLTGYNGALSHEDFVKATFRLDFADLDHGPYWGWLEKRYTEAQLRDPIWQKKIYTVKPYTTNYCPMNCSFCSTTQFYRAAGDGKALVVGLRGEDLERYLILILENQPRSRTVLFKDDLWFIRGTGGREGLCQDLDALARVRARFPQRDITYSAKARVDTIVDPKSLAIDLDLVARAKHAGFFSLSLGIESFDVTELDYFNKRIGPQGPLVNELALRTIRAAGIGTIGYVILSSPVSTIDSICRTLLGTARMVLEGHVMKVNPYLYTLPGTTIYHGMRKRPDLCRNSAFPIPGYPEVPPIERNVQVLPADPAAHALMTSFQEEIGRYEERERQRLGIRHYIAEVATPIKLKLLCKLLRRLRPEVEPIERSLTAFSRSSRAEPAPYLTFA